MGDIIDNEEVDRDIVEPEVLQKHFSKKYKLLTETAVSLNKSYINKLHCTKSLQMAVSLSDNTFEVYQLRNTSLQRVCRLSGHKNTLTEVVCSPKDEHLVYSAGHDGMLKLWDIRSGGSCAMEYKDEEDTLIRPYECMDVSCNGLVLCAGSQVIQDDAYLVFWDQRLPKPLGGYWNSHTEDITQVKFHKEKTEILTTGSLDGLMNVFDIMEQTEDDALTYSLNVENSVEKITWLDSTQVACITQSNELQVWDTEEGDLLSGCTKEKVARSIRRSKADDCYLVDAFNSIDDTIVLLAGSHGGNGDVLRSVTLDDRRLLPTTNFTENKQIVRCCWYDKDRDLLVTTGESGLISVWSACADEEDGAASKPLSTSLNKLHVNRHKPY
ncbi:hypothetical protein O3G_MSEX012205 [Manduca sexta]|uniref:WD repeat-containing protein 89 n=1 Tax=Manduca sexta TaxID=7130 RepID=A0A922CWD3_MANSE|nr:hypothetical protein O3G_MSEX012205 [Manduca sexta]